MPTTNLQNLYQLKNQPGQNPEDSYLQQLASQPGQTLEPTQPYPSPAGTATGPSEAGISSLQDQYNRAANLKVAQHGLGSLGGAIQALFLRKKLNEVNQQAEGVRRQEAGVKMEASILANQEKKQQLAEVQSKLDYAKGLSYLGAVQSGTDRSPESVQKGGASFNPDGTIKVNADMINEWKAKGNIKYNVTDLIPHAFGLVGELQKVHSTFTQDEFLNKLTKASEAKTARDIEITKANAAKYQSPYEGLKVFGNLTNGFAQSVTNFLDPNLQILGGPVIAAMMGQSLIPQLQAINKTGRMAGVFQTGQEIDPKEMLKAIDDASGNNASQTQDPRALMMIMSKIQNYGQRGAMLEQKPENSADREKTTKPPIVTGTSTSSTTVKKSGAPKNASNLQMLGQ